MDALDVKIQPVTDDVVGLSINQVRKKFFDGDADIVVLVNGNSPLGGYVIKPGDRVEIMRCQPV